jgi:tRNA pseudouridine38-40 synthase
MRIALGVEYDGSAFSGYQFQSHAPSIQDSLQRGVHATGQVVAFDTNADRPLTAWVRGGNTLTPGAVSIRWARPVPDDFHPRFQATARRYMYLFYEAETPSPLLEGRAVRTEVLADEPMHQAAGVLLGEQDFSAFRAAGCQASGPFRCVHRVSVLRAGPFVILDITANAFLLHMVRNIAGSLWKVGQGLEAPDWIEALLTGRDRNQAAPTAPPQGLYLVDVRYPEQDLPPGEPPGMLRALGGLERF